MKATMLFKGFLFLTAICLSPAVLRANTGKPIIETGLKQAIHIHLMQDTIPKPVKPVNNSKVKEDVDVIKTIPIARKQPIPVPVNVKITPVKITPVKITKPKILKPVIKLLP